MGRTPIELFHFYSPELKKGFFGPPLAGDLSQSPRVRMFFKAKFFNQSPLGCLKGCVLRCPGWNMWIWVDSKSAMDPWKGQCATCQPHHASASPAPAGSAVEATTSCEYHCLIPRHHNLKLLRVSQHLHRQFSA